VTTIFNESAELKDSSGVINRSNPLQVQSLSASKKPYADDPHSRIHQGVMFNIDSTGSSTNVVVANNATLDVVIKATGTNYPHISISYRLGGKGRILVYELASNEMSTGGTEIIIVNKKWGSSIVFGGTAWRNPTIDLTGAICKEGCAILGIHQGQTRSGSAGTFADEIILTPIKPCLIRVLNESGGAVDACLCINAYNASTIADN